MLVPVTARLIVPNLSVSWPRVSLAPSHQTISLHGLLPLAATGSLSNLGSQGKEASFPGVARAQGDDSYWPVRLFLALLAGLVQSLTAWSQTLLPEPGSARSSLTLWFSLGQGPLLDSARTHRHRGLALWNDARQRCMAEPLKG